MSQAHVQDFEIDLTTGGFAEDGNPFSDREDSLLNKSYGYKKVLIQPSKDIGCGSYGHVVKAKLDNLPCAAKILHHAFFVSNDPNVSVFISRFKQECRLLRQLKHPCIVQFLGVLEDTRHCNYRSPILLMELMEQSLTHLLESLRSPIVFYVQVDISYDISLALDYLHNNGIQHRDISSNNILLTAGSRAKLTDFGMSRIVEINPQMSRNKQTACPGTLAYMPPEVLQPTPIYSDKIDVFSFGVLIIQTITRKFPTPSDPHCLVQDPKYQQPILVRVPELERRKHDLHGLYLSHPLRPLVLQCIQDDKQERPTAANICQLLAELMSSQMYKDSHLQYLQQMESLPQTRSAIAMRDLEIQTLEKEIKALNQQKRSSWGAIFHKKDMSKIDAKISEMNLQKRQLVLVKEFEQEEEQKRLEYANENTHLKNKVGIFEQKFKQALSDIAKLEKSVQHLLKEKVEAEGVQAQLLAKVTELKHIVKNHLQSDFQDDAQHERKTATKSSQKITHTLSLPNLTLFSDEDLVTTENDILRTKVIQLNLSELYQCLNVENIIQQMVERRLILQKNMETCASPYAQNISVAIALIDLHMKSSPAFLFSLCVILETADPNQRKLAQKLKSDFGKHYSVMNREVPQRFYPSKRINSRLELKVKDLQSQFLQALKLVIEAFEKFPVPLHCLTQFLSQLTLPGKVSSTIIDPDIYKNATNTKELFMAQATLGNCFSPHLLTMISEGCECPAAIQAMQEFTEIRSKFSNSLIFEQIYCLPEESIKSNKQSSLLKYHLCPLSELQSLHPSLFDYTEDHKGSKPSETVRITVEVDRPYLTLQDYDDITTAVCGYFHIPRAALVYAGCSEDGRIICWTTFAGVLPYLRSIPPTKGSDRLMAEQRILAVSAGDLYYRCPNLKEVELYEASFYGLTKRVQKLVDQITHVNFVTKSGWTPLMMASFKGHADIVQILIEKAAVLDKKDSNGWTSLHLAALGGKVDVVKQLIKAKAQINLQTENGQTALYIATRKGHKAVVELLLEQQADHNICHEDGSTPLMIAAYKGHIDILKKYMKAAMPEINSQKEDGCTALHLAAYEGRTDVVKLLTEAHAHVNIPAEDGRTPLYIAIRQGHAEIIKILLQQYADIALCTKDNWTPLMAASFDGHAEVAQILIEAGATTNTQKEDGRTALYIASAKGHGAVVKLLLSHDADVDICKENGWIPLMVASCLGYYEIVKALAEAGTQTINRQNKKCMRVELISTLDEYNHCFQARAVQQNAFHLHEVNDGSTALAIATEEGHNEIVSLLLQLGADHSICDKKTWTPLMTASHYGKINVVHMLIDAKANINQQTEDGWTALHLAAKEGHSEIVGLLINALAQLNLQTVNGTTALFIASKNGNKEIVELLLQNQADVSLCKKNGWTPLMIASFTGQNTIVELLIRAKANIDTQDQKGWTALHLAAKQGKIDVVRLLTEGGAQVNMQTEEGITALFLASMKGHGSVATWLLHKHADVGICNKTGWTPLMVASFEGNCDIVQGLLQAHADTDTQNEDGWTALHLAAQESKNEVLKLLMDAEANINLYTQDGKTALDIAIWRGEKASVMLLMACFADMNIHYMNGKTPLMTAASSGNTEIVKMLVEANADVNAEDKDGWTALHFAALNGNFDVVKILIELEADVNLLNKDDMAPIDLARAQEHTKIVEILTII